MERKRQNLFLFFEENDDEKDIRQLIGQILSDEGYQVCLASNSETAMEEINSKKGLSIVLNRFYQSGLIRLSEMKYLEKKILHIVDHPDLKRYYDDDLVCFNEREIISKKGYILVPDRLAFLNDTDVVIIDYKTGKENDSHKIQLNKYKSVIEEMNFKVTEKILIYINEKIKIYKSK